MSNVINFNYNIVHIFHFLKLNVEVNDEQQKLGGHSKT